MKPHVALVVTAGTALALAGQASAAGWPIELVERPAGKPVKRIVLLAEKPGAKVTSLVFARASGPRPFKGVGIFVGPLSHQGVRVSAGDLDIRADGRVVQAAGVTIPARPKLLALSFSLTAPSVPGVYRGRVYGLHGGQARFLFTLVVRVEPLLELVGLGSEGIKLERRAASVAQTVRVRSRAVRGYVTFDAEPLTSPNSTEELLELTVDGDVPSTKGIWFSPGQTKVMALKVSAPLAGNYRSSVTIARRGFRQVIPVSIMRTREAPTIEVLNISRLHQEADFFPPWRDRPWEDFDVSFTAVLHETAGDVFDVGIAVAKLVRVEGESEISEDLANVDVLGVDESEGPFKVSNDEHVNVVINVGELGPGSYSGIIRAQVAGAPAVDTPFVLTVRRSWVLAAAMIALGMLTALLLRKWFGGEQRSLKRHVSLKGLRREIAIAEEAAKDEAEASLFARLHASLDSLASGTFTDAEARIARLRRRLDLSQRWRETRRDSLDGPASVKVRKELATIGSLLEADKEPDSQTKELDLDRVSGRLGAIEEMLHRHRRARVTLGEETDPALTTGSGQQVDATPLRPTRRYRLRRWIAADLSPLRDWIDLRLLRDGVLFFGSWLALLAIAVVLGLNLLWQGDATWGDFGDCVAAFLWGAGLQQVGGVTFQGLLGLSEKVGAPPAPTTT